MDFHRSACLPALVLASVLTLAARAGAQLTPAIRNFDRDVPATAAALPALLSQSGLYKNIGSKATRAIADTNAIVAFEVNSALWSDGSHKERYISVPIGTKVTPTDSGKYTFPDNTVLVKNFAVDTVYGDSTTRIYVETRFLVYQSTATEKKWSGISYRWRRDQTDAELVSTDINMGLDTTILVKLNGTLVGKRWRYPSTMDCKACHQGDESVERGSLGFITPQLNRMIGNTNQLARLVAKNVLTVNPIAGKQNPHRWYGIKETGTDATLEKKVRSYFASNCSHCHGNNVKHGNAVHNFDYFNATKPILFSQDSIGGWVDKTAMSNGDYSLIRPGKPDSSLILYKMLTRFDEPLSSRAEQMPPLATSQVDSGAVKLIRDWICSLKTGTACAQPEWMPDNVNWDEDAVSIRRHFGFRGAKYQVRIEGGMLSLPAAFASGSVELRDSQGRSVPLRPAGGGRFRLPPDLKAGAYLLRAGAHSSLLPYLP